LEVEKEFYKNILLERKKKLKLKEEEKYPSPPILT